MSHVFQLEVVKRVETFDLIPLSFCSQKAKALVKNANVQLAHLDFRFNGSNSLNIYVNAHLNMSCTRESSGSEHEPVESSVKVIWTDNRDEVPRQLVLMERSFDCLGEHLTGHILETFQRVDDISVSNQHIPILNIPVWKYTKSIKNFISIIGSEEKLSLEEIKFILKDLTIKRRLTICPPVVDTFHYSRGFRQIRVIISNAKWVKFEAILESRSLYIDLDLMKSAAQLNNFLKIWMSKTKMKNLKGMLLGLQEGPEEFGDTFLTEVFYGILHVRHNAKVAKIQRVDGRQAFVKILSTTELEFEASPANQNPQLS